MPSSDHFRLMEMSLGLARRQLLEQATLLKDAQSRVELLVGVQDQLRTSLCTKEGPSKLPPSESASADGASTKAVAGDGEASRSGTSVAELRGLLRIAVRMRLGQQLEVEAMREALSSERTANEARDAQYRRCLAELDQSHTAHATAEAQLGQLQEDHTILTTRICELEEQVTEMQRDQERAKQLQAALAAAEPEPTMLAPPILAPVRAVPPVMSGMMEL